MSSSIRQNFHEEVEAAINRQINMELRASYVYMSMVILSFKFLTQHKNDLMIDPLLYCDVYVLLR
jgi:hypothetical protein